MSLKARKRFFPREHPNFLCRLRRRQTKSVNFVNKVYNREAKSSAHRLTFVILHRVRDIPIFFYCKKRKAIATLQKERKGQN